MVTFYVSYHPIKTSGEREREREREVFNTNLNNQSLKKQLLGVAITFIAKSFVR